MTKTNKVIVSEPELSVKFPVCHDEHDNNGKTARGTKKEREKSRKDKRKNGSESIKYLCHHSVRHSDSGCKKEARFCLRQNCCNREGEKKKLMHTSKAKCIRSVFTPLFSSVLFGSFLCPQAPSSRHPRRLKAGQKDASVKQVMFDCRWSRISLYRRVTSAGLHKQHRVCISCWQISSFSSKAPNPGHMTVHSARGPIHTDVQSNCRSSIRSCMCGEELLVCGIPGSAVDSRVCLS